MTRPTKHIIRTLGVFLAGFVLALPLLAFAQPGGGGRGGRGGGGAAKALMRPEILERVAAEIGLSDEKVTAIKAKLYEAQKKNIDLKSKVEEARLDLRRLMDADNPDVDRVVKQVGKVGELETEMKQHHIRVMLTVRNMLNPAQRAKLQELMMSDRRERRDRRGGGPGGPGMGPGGRGFDGPPGGRGGRGRRGGGGPEGGGRRGPR